MTRVPSIFATILSIFLGSSAQASLQYPEIPALCKNLNSPANQEKLFRDLEILKNNAMCSSLPLLGSCEGVSRPLLAVLPAAMSAGFKASESTYQSASEVIETYAGRSPIVQKTSQRAGLLAIEAFKRLYRGQPDYIIGKNSLPPKFSELDRSLQNQLRESAQSLFDSMEEAFAQGVKLVDANGKITAAGQKIIAQASAKYGSLFHEPLIELFGETMKTFVASNQTLVSKFLEASARNAAVVGARVSANLGWNAFAQSLQKTFTSNPTIEGAEALGAAGAKMFFVDFAGAALAWFSMADPTSACADFNPPSLHYDSECQNLIYAHSAKTLKFLARKPQDQLNELRAYPGECAYFEKFAEQLHRPKYENISCQRKGFSVSVNGETFEAQYNSEKPANDSGDHAFFIASVKNKNSGTSLSLSKEGRPTDLDASKFILWQKINSYITDAHECCSQSKLAPEKCLQRSPSSFPADSRSITGVR